LQENDSQRLVLNLNAKTQNAQRRKKEANIIASWRFGVFALIFNYLGKGKVFKSSAVWTFGK